LEYPARDWLSAHLLEADRPPLSFTYGGAASAELLPTWRLERASREVDGRRVAHTLTWTDPATGLELRSEAMVYRDFPAVEWTPYFRNRGSVDTPILADIQAIDATFERPTFERPAFGRPPEGEFVLHHAVGSPARASDYQPLETPLRPGAQTRIATRGGRPSDSDLPYFNVAWRRAGAIIAIGWPGQWAAHFARDSGANLRLRAGQELTHFRLHPDEEVRAPLIALLFYEGDWIDGQNLWRRWMLAHNLPRLEGGLPAPFMPAGSSGQFNEMENATGENQKLFIDRYLAEGIPIDLWWMDAGWYVTETGRWPETGTWEEDSRRFPDGLRAVADHAHARGLRCLVWFEPERVAPGSWLDRNHPDWLLSIPGGRWKLLDLGNPAAWRWAVEHFDRLIREQGIDVYRQDFNVAPLDYWRAHDAPDRQGIAELRHVTGYLAYWDELRRRHPAMLLDTCASGGRRLDLETLRRSVPLHKSDHDYGDYAARQSQAYGIAFWIPFHGAPVCRNDQVDVYAFRSAAAPMVGLGFDVRRTDLDYALLRRLAAEWRRIADYYFGDFYPLTSHSIDERDWLAWQYHRPEPGDGLIQAFRRAESPYVSARFRLRGLETAATYRLSNLDDDRVVEATGRALMDAGLPLTLEARPTSAVIVYSRTP
jgi:alpha-galactosidase